MPQNGKFILDKPNKGAFLHDVNFLRMRLITIEAKGRPESVEQTK